VQRVNVQLLFDFGSPNAYLDERITPEVEWRGGVKFEYVPILFGGIYKLTNNRSSGDSLAGIKHKRRFTELETQRFIRRHTTFRKNPFFPLNTSQLTRAGVAAQAEGVFDSYFRAAYDHIWEHPRMDDPQIAPEAFISSNIDSDRLFACAAAERQSSPRGHDAGRGQARRVRIADLLCRQRDVLRQGSAARRGGSHSHQEYCGTNRTSKITGLRGAPTNA
jgi:2-hydroxychromene-2-carboxylate isomerase